MGDDDAEMTFEGSPEDPGGENGSNTPSDSLRPRRPHSDDESGQAKKSRKNHVLDKNDNNGVHANIPVSNRFDTLGHEVEEHETIRTSRSVNVNKNSKVKVPPFTVCDISMNDLIKNLRQSPESPVYRNYDNVRYRLTSNGIKVIVNTVEEFKQVRTFLHSSGIKFFSHPLDEEKTMKYVMYGLHDINEDELKEVLSDYELFPTSVSKLKINKRRHDDQNIYMLQFTYDQNVSLERLRTVRHIDGVIVKFDRYMRNKTGLTQCSNCLRFSHGAKNCFLPPRCIRCGEAHSSAVCDKLIIPRDPKSKIPAAQVKCANCGGRHTANFEKCPERQKYLASRQNIKDSLRNKITSHTQRRTDPLIPPRTTTLNVRPHAQNGPRHQFSYAQVLKSTENDLFQPMQLYQIFKRFMNELLKCKSKSEQIDVIARITFDCLSNDCP